MATQKQIEANRLNAQHSTGPKSPEMKAKTRLNAVRDGFTGQVTTLSDEDRPVFEQFKLEFVKDLAPKTTLELSLASSIAWDTWRLNHLRAVEMNMFALGAADNSVEIESGNPETHTAISDAVTFGNEAKRFALMSIYEQRMNRSLHKNLALLLKLQAERKANYGRDLKDETLFARARDARPLPHEAPPPAEIGSVFSSTETSTAAPRSISPEAASMPDNEPKFETHSSATASSQPSNVTEGQKLNAA